MKESFTKGAGDAGEYMRCENCIWYVRKHMKCKKSVWDAKK